MQHHNTPQYLVDVSSFPAFSSKPSKLKAALLFLGMVLLAVTSVQAQAITVVDWGGDYIASGDLALAYPTGVASGSTTVYAYNASTPISPSSGYTAPSGKSGLFYGGGYITSTSTVTGFAAGNPNIRNSGTTDRIRYNRNGVSGRLLSGAVFTDFLKTDFLNGGASQTLAFGLNSGSPIGSLSLAITESVNATYRFAVLNAGQWYLSFDTASSGTFNITSANILSSTWGAWNPTGGANGRLADVPSTFLTTGSAFTNIQGFGYYVGFNGGDNQNITSAISGFSAQAMAAVPEPSTWTLLACGSALVLWRLRRRQCGKI